MYFCCLGLITISSVSQVTNINPNSNEGPWTIGPGNSLGESSPLIIDPVALLSLPTSVDNSTEIYFYEIFNQSPSTYNLYNSCAQASGVTYTFTYEINRLREKNADNEENQYPQCYTWNYLNGNENQGSDVIDGWEIIMDNGCPNMTVWENGMYDDIAWLSEFQQYESGIWNRINSHSHIVASNTYPNGIEEIKAWLSNHNTGNNEIPGGVGVFIRAMGNYQVAQLGSGPHSGEEYLISSAGEMHLMTIVGYHDLVNCGSFGYGAFKVANSWGPSFCNQGFVWLPYELANDFIALHIIEEVDYRQPQVIAKIKIKHNKRNMTRIGIHISDNPSNSAPSELSDYSKVFYAMDTESHPEDWGGGELPLDGYNDVPIEIGYDISDFIQENYPNQAVPNLKFILGVEETDPDNEGFGEILDFSIVDYRIDPNEPFVVYDHNDPIPIENNSITQVPLYYFVHPSTISTDETYTYPTIVRDEVTITGNATLSIHSNYFDFYDGGNLVVSENATLFLPAPTNVIAMRGDGQIELRGTMNALSSVVFDERTALPQPEFILFINNVAKDYTFKDFSFTGSIVGESNSLDLDNILFESSSIEYEGDLSIDALDPETQNLTVDLQGGNLLVQNNDLLKNTYISASMPSVNQNSIVIQDNVIQNINSTESKAVISINDYKIFTVENNEIEINHCNGIELYHAGNNVGADKNITSNEIFSTNASGDCRAIDVFFSRANISNNHIHDNKYGVAAFGNSETTILGNQNANYVSQTQRFIENSTHCYFSYSSYPEEIRYNHFQHDPTNTNPFVKLVYFDIENPYAGPPPIDFSTIYNIECNSWCSTFNPDEDLIPVGSYDYDPYWTIGQYCIKDGGIAGQLYDEAKELIDSGFYYQADSNLKVIISDFPEDSHAIHSLRELYTLEEVDGNNYDSLRIYYRSVIEADQDSLLCRSADWMSMHCLIMMDSSQKAINWLDSVINVPQNTVDSIFAIINLGYIYTHFPDTTYKSYLFTMHNDLVPKSYNDYKIRREELIQQLLKSSPSNESDEYVSESSASIIQIAPNPTKDTFKSIINVLHEGYLKVEIYSALGAKIKELNLGKVQAGKFECSLSLINQPQGMYYVVVKHNNIAQETKKIIKL